MESGVTSLYNLSTDFIIFSLPFASDVKRKPSVFGNRGPFRFDALNLVTMKHIYLLLMALGLGALHAQEIMLGSSLTLDFEHFQGGFAPAPTIQELDSDNWTLDGFEPMAYVSGGVNNTGDYLPRQTRGGVGTAGIYALAYTSEDTAIWFQATGTDFTPVVSPWQSKM